LDGIKHLSIQIADLLIETLDFRGNITKLSVDFQNGGARRRVGELSEIIVNV